MVEITRTGAYSVRSNAWLSITHVYGNDQKLVLSTRGPKAEVLARMAYGTQANELDAFIDLLRSE